MPLCTHDAFDVIAFTACSPLTCFGGCLHAMTIVTMPEVTMHALNLECGWGMHAAYDPTIYSEG